MPVSETLSTTWLPLLWGRSQSEVQIKAIEIQNALSLQWEVKHSLRCWIFSAVRTDVSGLVHSPALTWMEYFKSMNVHETVQAEPSVQSKVWAYTNVRRWVNYDSRWAFWFTEHIILCHERQARDSDYNLIKYQQFSTFGVSFRWIQQWCGHFKFLITTETHPV